jgi:transcriptional regulator with GAF, ATPase, and Fis domain
VNQTISLVDEVMRQISLKSLVETVEQRLPALFDCERATVVLVHRHKKFLFRIVKDGEVDTYKKYMLSEGVSGMVACSSKDLKSSGSEPRFNQELDDPHWVKGQNPALNMLSFPV